MDRFFIVGVKYGLRYMARPAKFKRVICFTLCRVARYLCSAKCIVLSRLFACWQLWAAIAPFIIGYRFVSIDLWEPVRFRGEAVQDEHIPRRDPLYINFTWRTWTIGILIFMEISLLKFLSRYGRKYNLVYDCSYVHWSLRRCYEEKRYRELLK